MVGVSAEAGDPPPGVDGVRSGFPQAAEGGKMMITDRVGTELLQGFFKRVAAEVRKAPRTGELTDVRQNADPVFHQEFRKFIEGTGGMTDGVKEHGGPSLPF